MLGNCGCIADCLPPDHAVVLHALAKLNPACAVADNAYPAEFRPDDVAYRWTNGQGGILYYYRYEVNGKFYFGQPEQSAPTSMNSWIVNIDIQLAPFVRRAQVKQWLWLRGD